MGVTKQAFKSLRALLSK